MFDMLALHDSIEVLSTDSVVSDWMNPDSATAMVSETTLEASMALMRASEASMIFAFSAVVSTFDVMTFDALTIEKLLISGLYSD